MTDELHKTPTEQFAIIEYQQAANAYFQGADMGWRAVSQFITLNTILFAGVGIAQEGVTSEIVLNLLKIIPIVGFTMSFLLMLGFLYFLRQLKNCEDRCAAIELENGGQLFQKIKETARRKNGIGMSTRSLFFAFALLLMAIWVFLGIQMGTFELFALT